MIPLFLISAIVATPLLKFTYFNVRGRGEAIRLALEDNRIPYENDIVENPQWKAIKKTGIADGSLPFGQLPRLTMNDGTAVVQSNAILRWIGRHHELYGEEPYLADMIIDAVEDWRKLFSKLLYQDKLEKGKLEEYKAKLNSEFNEETGGTKGGILSQYENILIRKESLFYGGNAPSVADYALFSLIENNMCFIDDFFANFENLNRWFIRMNARVHLKAYIQAGHEWRNRNSGAGVGDCKPIKTEL